MPDLHTLQTTITAAILAGDMSRIADEFTANAASSERRLNIYRNNTFISLTECLKTIFPVTLRLSDERFFAYAAHTFIAHHPPREARLSGYGAEFPGFLSRFAPCRDFPIIAEMAAFEWAIQGSLNDGEHMPIAISALDTLSLGDATVAFSLQPNLRFAVARRPLLGVWLDHQRETVVITSPLNRKISRNAIFRHGEDLQFLELEPARFAFWHGLARGLPVEAAAQRALARDPLFDLVRETLLLFRSNLVTGIFSTLEQE